MAPVLARDRPELAERLHERIRRLRGHLSGTQFGTEMRIAVSIASPAA